MGKTLVGERGIDTGGLSRELMTMVMRAIQESVIFRGEGTNNELSRDVTGMFTCTPMLSRDQIFEGAILEFHVFIYNHSNIKIKTLGRD